jgi:hypothetical protein
MGGKEKVRFSSCEDRMSRIKSKNIRIFVGARGHKAGIRRFASGFATGKLHPLYATREKYFPHRKIPGHKAEAENPRIPAAFDRNCCK